MVDVHIAAGLLKKLLHVYPKYMASTVHPRLSKLKLSYYKYQQYYYTLSVCTSNISASICEQNSAREETSNIHAAYTCG